MAVIFYLFLVIHSLGKCIILKSGRGFKTEWFSVAKKKF